MFIFSSIKSAMHSVIVLLCIAILRLRAQSAIPCSPYLHIRLTDYMLPGFIKKSNFFIIVYFGSLIYCRLPSITHVNTKKKDPQLLLRAISFCCHKVILLSNITHLNLEESAVTIRLLDRRYLTLYFTPGPHSFSIRCC